MFVIIWGTKSRQECLGTVADWCPACRRPRAFAVTKYFRVGHIYYISLGRGSLVAAVRQCRECGSQYRCADEDYEALVPEKAVQEMSLNELLQQTNSVLKEQLDARRAQIASGQGPSRPQNENEVRDVLPADDGTTG
jgi:hypothetical protein